MKKLLVVLSIAICSCAWFKSNEKAIDADGLTLLGCVVNAAESGMIVETIATTCGPMLVVNVINILDNAQVEPVSSPAFVLARKTTNRLSQDAGAE